MKFFAASLIMVLLLISAGAAPVRAACDDPYTVQPGDSLVSIAEECGVDNYIVLGNINPELSDPNVLRPGQVIRLTAEMPIPFKGATGAPQAGGMQEGGVYLVRPGDSLGRIAYLYNTTVNEIYRTNPQLGWRPIIYPGQTIQLPKDARLNKGWVGVSEITAQAYDDIEARIADFPPYTEVDFVLRVKWESIPEYKTNNPYGSPEDMVIVDGKTDARGEARAVLSMPYWASLLIGKPWVVEVSTVEIPKRVIAQSAEIMICGTHYDWELGEYVTDCGTPGE